MPTRAKQTAAQRSQGGVPGSSSMTNSSGGRAPGTGKPCVGGTTVTFSATSRFGPGSSVEPRSGSLPPIATTQRSRVNPIDTAAVREPTACITTARISPERGSAPAQARISCEREAGR